MVIFHSYVSLPEGINGGETFWIFEVKRPGIFTSWIQEIWESYVIYIYIYNQDD
jgi:hypothetical protein